MSIDLTSYSNALNEGNIRKAHVLLSKNIPSKNKQGKYRAQNIYIPTPEGRIEYVAVSHFEAENEMKKFYTDVAILLKREMSIEEVFFFASMIHLVFVKSTLGMMGMAEVQG